MVSLRLTLLYMNSVSRRTSTLPKSMIEQLLRPVAMMLPTRGRTFSVNSDSTPYGPEFTFRTHRASLPSHIRQQNETPASYPKHGVTILLVTKVKQGTHREIFFSRSCDYPVCVGFGACRSDGPRRSRSSSCKCSRVSCLPGIHACVSWQKRFV